jgi:hypothetical protein
MTVRLEWTDQQAYMVALAIQAAIEATSSDRDRGLLGRALARLQVATALSHVPPERHR